MFKKSIIVIAVLSSLSLRIYSAKSENKNETFDLGEIVVTGTRIPQPIKKLPLSIEVISQEKIEDSEFINSSEALSELLDIEIGKYGYVGALSTVMIRGSSAEQVLILLDGRALSNLITGNFDLSTVMLDNVEKIEVLRGPASSMYGANAIGGVVNIVTKSKVEKPRTSVTTSYGSYNLQTYQLFHSNKFDNFDVNIGASYLHSDGYRINSKDDGYNLDGSLIYGLSEKLKFKFSGGYYSDIKGAPGLISFPSLFATDKNKRAYFSAKGDASFDSSLLHGNVYWNMNDRIFEDKDILFPQYNTNIVNTLGSEWQYDMALNTDNTLTVGFLFYRDKIESSQISNKQADTASVFVQEQMSLIEDVFVSGALRYDYHSVYQGQLNMQLSLGYQVLQNTKIYTSFGTAFRAPTFDDLYQPLVVYSGGSTRGNENLRSEKSWSIEAGVQQSFTNDVFGKLTYFYSETRDLIMWASDSSGNWTPNNVGNASTQGIEAELKSRFLSNFEGYVNYTYLLAKDKDSGSFLIYRPKNKINAGVNYMSPWKQLIGLEAEYYDARFHDAANTVELSSIVIMNFKFTQNIEDYLSLFVKIDNLENKEYELRKYYPMPRRTIRAGVTVQL